MTGNHRIETFERRKVKSISDQIYTHMIEEKREFTNTELLTRFFKIDINDEETARKIIEPILRVDSRFKRLSDERWAAVKRLALEQLPVNAAPFVLFSIDEIKKLKNREREKDFFSVLGEYSSFLLYKGGNIRDDLSIRDILKQLNSYIFVPYDAKSLDRLKRIYRIVSPLRPEIITLSVKALSASLFPEKRLGTWDDIIREFSITSFQSNRPCSKTKTLMHVFEHILKSVQERGVVSVRELVALSSRGKKVVDFSRYAFDKNYLRDIPVLPGVYLFYNRQGDVIYVGKTNNLRSRIFSYFWNTGESLEKIKTILNQLYRIEYRILGSDLEALIEEYKLIDKHRPVFNTKMKIPERKIEVSSKILLLPSAKEGMIKLYFLSEKSPLREHDFDCSKPDSDVVHLLQRMHKDTEDLFDPLKIIALLYLKRYGENINTIELDRYANGEGVLNALKLHCKNMNEIDREKVVYI